jgi:UDP-perosamine 4-acetyltransferase
VNLPIVIIGAGGHAKVIADALRAAGEPILGFTDEDPLTHGTRLLGLPVLGGDDVIAARSIDAVRLANGIGSIGSPTRRRDIYLKFRALGYAFVTIVHPRAVISPAAELEEGAQVMAGAVIQPGVVVGVNSIVNTAAIVDHDCVIGQHCHIAPGCVLSGGIVVGDECHVGTGATIRQGVKLGSRTVVGVGAAVVSDFGGEGTLVGVPARVVE